MPGVRATAWHRCRVSAGSKIKQQRARCCKWQRNRSVYCASPYLRARGMTVKGRTLAGAALTADFEETCIVFFSREWNLLKQQKIWTWRLTQPIAERQKGECEQVCVDVTWHPRNLSGRFRAKSTEPPSPTQQEAIRSGPWRSTAKVNNNMETCNCNLQRMTLLFPTTVKGDSAKTDCNSWVKPWKGSKPTRCSWERCRKEQLLSG